MKKARHKRLRTVLFHLYEIYRIGKSTETETLVDARGWELGLMNWEIGIDMYTLICINWMTNKNLLHKEIYKIKFKKESSHHKKKFYNHVC